MNNIIQHITSIKSEYSHKLLLFLDNKLSQALHKNSFLTTYLQNIISDCNLFEK